jgi:hypothetical protein
MLLQSFLFPFGPNVCLFRFGLLRLQLTIIGFAFGGAFYIRLPRTEADSWTNVQILFCCSIAFGHAGTAAE